MQSLLSNYAGSGSLHTAQRLFSTIRIECELACLGAAEINGVRLYTKGKNTFKCPIHSFPGQRERVQDPQVPMKHLEKWRKERRDQSALELPGALTCLHLQFLHQVRGLTHSHTHTTQSEGHCWGQERQVCWWAAPCLSWQCRFSSVEATLPAFVPEVPLPNPSASMQIRLSPESPWPPRHGGGQLGFEEIQYGLLLLGYSRRTPVQLAAKL